MEGVRELYNDRGIVLKPVDLNGLLLYGAYNMVHEAAGGWGLKPGGVALAKACTRIFQPDGKEYLRRWFTYQTEKHSEEYYRRIFHKSGLLLTPHGDISTTFTDASEHISPKIYGEVVPTVGDGVRAEVEGYDGIIIIGPFNCLPFRIAEAILKPLSIQRGMPILTYESDGYAVSPSFLQAGRGPHSTSSRSPRAQSDPRRSMKRRGSLRRSVDRNSVSGSKENHNPLD